MTNEKQKGSRLPIVLSRRPRHRTETGDWEVEFILEELNKGNVAKQVASILLIIGTALDLTERNRTELKQRSSISVRLSGLEGFLRELNTVAVICAFADKGLRFNKTLA